MRCMNCGWDNRAEATACLKCGQPLSHNAAPSAEMPAAVPHPNKYEPFIPKPTVLNANVQEARCKETVIFNTNNGLKTDEVQSVVTCVNCGYPIADTFTQCPACGSPRHRPTVLRQIKNVAEATEKKPEFSLTTIQEADENNPAQKTDYEGSPIILNRNNTEQTNPTITSKEQAEISYEDGHWFISNKSEMGTTYIQVNRKMEIHPNDIIVLGDRRFKFENKEL